MRLLNALLAAGAVTLAACFPALAQAETIKLGVMAGEEEEVAEVARDVAAKHGLTVELTTFSDYTIPNEALSAGDLDANAFQHKPYLDAQIAARGYKIEPAGYTILEPIGFYSRAAKSLDALPDGAEIGIPNDPSNEARALKLLAANGLFTLKPGSDANATVQDIADNPKHIRVSELDAALIPNQLPDLAGAVINTNYALAAGLDPRTDALVKETAEGNPYRNFIAVRTADKDKPWVKELAAAYQSPEVEAFLDRRFKGAIVPGWK